MWRRIALVWFIATSAAFPAIGGEEDERKPTQVKVAAVQVLGYDKTDVPRLGLDPTEAVVRYVAKAAGDGVQLVVYPEYLLGRITVPGPETRMPTEPFWPVPVTRWPAPSRTTSELLISTPIAELHEWSWSRV